jgi:hypothetical protein
MAQVRQTVLFEQDWQPSMSLLQEEQLVFAEMR